MVTGPYRMRKRLVKNDMFYMHYPYIEQEKEQVSAKHRTPYSHDSKILYRYCQKYIAPNQNPANAPKRMAIFRTA